MRPTPNHSPRRSRTRPGTHLPVLAGAVLDALAPTADQVVVDATVGYGGHAEKFAKTPGFHGILIGMDVDGEQLQRTRQRLESRGVTLRAHHRNFSEIAEVLRVEAIPAADVIFADLGVSSMQIDDPQRGMHYKADGPLDMRMDDRLETTAADLLRTLPQERIESALRELSDEPHAARIAEWIVNQRQAAPLERVDQLVRLVLDAKGARSRGPKPKWNPYGSQHPAARTFQALRILVNDELGHLERLLEAAPGLLAPGGRIGIISFQPGEDRLVKRAFQGGVERGDYAWTCPKPITPSPTEAHRNPRSASGRFRWARK